MKPPTDHVPGRSVLSGAAALGGAGLLAKALSAVYRVLVAQWLGAEVVGLYEMAAPVLATGISICNLGLPVATSALVAGAFGRGEAASARGLRRAGRRLLLLVSAVGAAAVFVFAPALAGAIGNPAATGPLRAIAPGILLATLLAGEKAWLQGSGRVAASAVAVAVEQVARVGSALVAATAFRGGAPGAAAGAATALAWSPAVGAAGGIAACALTDRWRVPVAGGVAPTPPPPSAGAAVSALLRAGLPNWAGGVVSSLTTALDAAFVIWRLRAAGLDDYTATAWLGELNGMAMPLAAGPAVLLGALGSALIPDLAADWARGRVGALRRRGASAYFWSLAVAAPCALALWQLAEPICALIFPRNPGAALPLGLLAFVGIPLGLTYVAGAVANAVGQPAALLPGVTCGSVVRSGLVLALTGSYGLGVRGAAIGVVAGFALSAGLNVRAVHGLTGCQPPWWTFCAVGVPALAGQVFAAGAAWSVLAAAALPYRVLITGAVAALAYACIFLAGYSGWRGRLSLPVWPRI